MPDQDASLIPHATTPLVGRPRGAAWRSLQADGVVWEGQIFLVGDGLDLAARMIVTHRRVVFARGGEVVLEAERPWLRPAPYLRRDGTVLLSIAAPGARYGDPPATIAVRMRDGQPAAGHLVAMLSGSGARRVPADLDALEAIIRPALPSHANDRQDAQRNWLDASLWLDDPLLEGRELPPSAPTPVLPATAGGWPVAAEAEPVVRQPAPPVATGRDRDWNLPIRRHLVPRGQRRSKWGWALRLTGLVALLTAAAIGGAGRIPMPLESFGRGGETPAANAPVAQLTATTEPEIAGTTTETAAAALGVGGPRGGIEPSAGASLLEGRPTLQVGRGSLAASSEAGPPPPAAAVIVPIAADPVSTAPDEPEPQPDTAAQDATEEPTAPSAPTTAPSVAETPAPQPTTAPDPTELPVTAAAESTTAPDPTELPVTAAASTTAPDPVNDQAAAEPSEPSQPDLAATPRLAVGGPTLPAYGLPPSNDGNWVVIVVDVANQGDAPVTVPLSSFQLQASDGSEISLDPGSDLVASLVGLDPSGGPDESIDLGGGATRRLLLVYQIDPAAAGLTLLVGETAVDLTETLAAGGTIADLPADPSA